MSYLSLASFKNRAWSPNKLSFTLNPHGVWYDSRSGGNRIATFCD